MAKKDFIDWVERQAQVLRQKLALFPTQKLDPYQLANVMEVTVYSPHDIDGMSITSLEHLLGVDSDGWSAGALWSPDGRAFVVMNPNHAQTRRHATLMEELSHIHLQHRPTKLIITEAGIAMRDYSKTNETQAYWVGSAALVPRVVLLSAKSNAMNRHIVASNCGVSIDLVGFREKITGIYLR